MTTVPGSMEVIRVIGMKMRRRGGTSTINPRTLGATCPLCRVATASRTFPTWSPAGSKTAVPARRAIKTRFNVALIALRVPVRVILMISRRGGERASRSPIGGSDLIRLAIGIIGIGTSGPLIAWGAMAVPVAIFWRNLGGALITMPFAIARGEWRRLSKSSWGWSILAGIFLALHFICFFYSMRLTSVASGTALTATQPIFAALWLRFKGRRVDYRVWLGMAISMVGVLIITGVDSTLSTRSLVGDLVALLGGALAAAYVTAGSHVQKLVSTTTYTTICYLFCALTCLLVIVPSGASLISYPRFEWLLILGLIVGAQLLGHTMFNQVLVRVNPAVVSLIVFFEVPVGALLAAWWLGQVPPAGIIPGIALLIFGSGLVATRTSQLQGDKSDAD